MTTSLVTLQLPIPWDSLGFPPVPALGSTTLLDGDEPAWGWSDGAPAFAIPHVDPGVAGEPVPGWGVDHVVLLVPDLDAAKAAMEEIGRPARLSMEVRGRPAAFFRVGPVLEVIESPVRAAAIYGVALVTEEPLEVLTLRWRSLGFDLSDPRPAIQPGRRIVTVRGLKAGLAVMSPDRAPG